MTPTERIRASAVRSWLPETGLVGGPGDVSLAEEVRRWSRKWIAAGKIDLSRGFGGVNDFSAPAGGSWLVHPNGIALWCAEATEIRLASLILDHRIEQRALKEGDQKLIAGLSESALSDLCSILAGRFGVDGSDRWKRALKIVETEWQAPRSATLSGDSEGLFELVVETSLLVRLVREVSAKPSLKKMQTLSDGLKDQVVEVGAVLGQSRARLDELTTLQPGDVLLLDRDLAEPVDLAVDGAPSPRRCVIDTEEAALRLRLIA